MSSHAAGAAPVQVVVSSSSDEGSWSEGSFSLSSGSASSSDEFYSAIEASADGSFYNERVTLPGDNSPGMLRLSRSDSLNNTWNSSNSNSASLDDPDHLFVLKNLDTGETFQSDELWRIPTPFDPLRQHLRARTAQERTSSDHDTESGESGGAATHKASHHRPLRLRKLGRKSGRRPKRDKSPTRASPATASDSTSGALQSDSTDYESGSASDGTGEKKKGLRKSAKLKGKLLKSLHKSKEKRLARIEANAATDNENAPGVPGTAAAPSRPGRRLFTQRCTQVYPRAHDGPIWTMHFNYDGTLLATAGQDGAVAVWRAADSDEGGFLEGIPVGGIAEAASAAAGEERSSADAAVCRLMGHTRDVLDLSWSCSRSNLLLSASMDGSVRLWRVNLAGEEACVGGTFQHSDIVTSVAFHPRNESCFITACLDNRVRMWTVDAPEEAVRVVAVTGFITVLQFANTGFTATEPTLGSHTSDASLIAGTYDGRCVWFTVSDGETEASSRLEEVPGGCISVGGGGGRNSLRAGAEPKQQQKPGARRRKITGIELFLSSGVGTGGGGREYMLVTTSDSRARLVDLTTLQCLRTYSGLVNAHFQIGARFSETGKLLLCGSEDGNLLMWDTDLPPVGAQDRSKHEKIAVLDKLCASRTTVSCAAFAPFARRKNDLNHEEGSLLISADAKGEIKVWENIEKLASPP